MSLSAAEIAQVTAELAPRLRGAGVGKVFARDADTLVLELGRIDLVLAAHPRASRLHPEISSARTGAAPPAFAMLLRKRLGGLRLHDIHALPGERVVTFDFGAGKDRLIAELSGPHANVFLVDAAGMVVAALHRSHSTTRVLAPGIVYTPPPAGPAGAAWRDRRRFGDSPGVAERVAAHYDETLSTSDLAARRAAATVRLRREIAKVERREHALLGDLARADEGAHFRKLADLLLAHPTELPGRGATSVTLSDDFTDGSPLTIALDPTLDGRENAARLYRQHKRLTQGRKHAATRLAETRAAKAALIRRLESVATLDGPELDTLADQAPRQAPPRSARGRGSSKVNDAPRIPYRELASIDGHAIWVGRSAADNDVLTFRHARGGDLWLHCRDAAGSHVVIPLRSGAPASELTVLDAATLAAHYSQLRGETQVDVLITHVKNLRKVRGVPGRVYTSETRTLRVRMEPERLSRLLATASLAASD